MSDDHGKHDGGHHGAPGGHGGGHEEEEEAGAPEWLISFADMVMLLMGFFVILFALNVQPKGGNPGGGGEENEGVAHQPLEIDPEFIESVRKAFGNPLDPQNPEEPTPQPIASRRGACESRVEGTEERSLAPGHRLLRRGDHSVRAARPGRARFGAGHPEFVERNQGRQNVIEIRGHADEVERQGGEKAMQIALSRATAVATRLAAAGIEWERLRVTASGTTEPRRSGRGIDINPGENARVELLVRRESAMR